eukprot:TRINITY_DN11378_c0_g1_i1.p1 TRINITY_DN11378_c0_g1~~TRINITY_DN11378_c0_g1_i1.p1  ORF type:complete len:401 (+),score=45.97 TRINITY_DN11378_c0_g1_i1:29-1231(+)
MMASKWIFLTSVVLPWSTFSRRLPDDAERQSSLLEIQGPAGPQNKNCSPQDDPPSNEIPRPGISETSVCQSSHPEQVDVIRNELINIKFSYGFAEMIGRADCLVDLRVFMLDNSGSTSWAGGVVGQGSGNDQVRSVLRIEEIKDFAERQADDASVDRQYYTLNPQQVLITVPKEQHGRPDVEQKLKLVEPHQSTPLHVIVKVIQKGFQSDWGVKKKPIFVLVTDGTPDSTEAFVDALKQFASEAEFRVIMKLVDPPPQLQQLYDSIDPQVGFNYDVVCGIEEEAKQIVAAGNDFFVYSPFIHFIRGRGTESATLDLLDEKRLDDQHAMDLVEFLLMQNKEHIFFRRDPAEFVADAEEALAKAEPVYDPFQRKLEKPVNIKKLKMFFNLPQTESNKKSGGP